MSRATILAAVRANKPADRPLPALPTYTEDPAADLHRFTEVIAGSKGKVIRSSELASYVKTNFPDAKAIFCADPQVQGTVNVTTVQNPLELANLDLAIVKGQFAVAENGAVWVTEREAVVRVLPFITQHLILVVEGGIVPTMHEAYRRMRIDETGFGVFIAGPSKTADIEQSLVIGAHGPRSLAVVFPD